MSSAVFGPADHFVTQQKRRWPAWIILCALFVVSHGVVAVGRAVGFHWRADGFSTPYRWASAFGTALYAFLALLIAHQLARRRLSSRAAMVGVIVVWGASSLFIYQYLLPFWP